MGWPRGSGPVSCPPPTHWQEGRAAAPLPFVVSKQKQNPVTFSPSEDVEHSGTGGAFSKPNSAPSRTGPKHTGARSEGSAVQPAPSLPRHRGSFELLTSRSRVPHKFFGVVSTIQHPWQPDTEQRIPAAPPVKSPHQTAQQQPRWFSFLGKAVKYSVSIGHRWVTASTPQHFQSSFASFPLFVSTKGASLPPLSIPVWLKRCKKRGYEKDSPLTSHPSGFCCFVLFFLPTKGL